MSGGEPPDWHRQVLELARRRLSDLSSGRGAARLLFIKYGQIHCRTFLSDRRNADEPAAVDYQIWRRIEDLKGTLAEAYAVVWLGIWNDPSGLRTSVIGVAGAERKDPHEAIWLQRVSIDSNSGGITGHEWWEHEDLRKANAISSC